MPMPFPAWDGTLRTTTQIKSIKVTWKVNANQVFSLEKNTLVIPRKNLVPFFISSRANITKDFQNFPRLSIFLTTYITAGQELCFVHDNVLKIHWISTDHKVLRFIGILEKNKVGKNFLLHVKYCLGYVSPFGVVIWMLEWS